jgi:Mrp family chromosome partitioning ATPase
LEEAKKGMEARYTAIIGQPGLKEAFITGGTGSSSSSSTHSSSGAGSMGNSENAQTRMISDMAESSTGIASLQAKIASLSSSLAQVKAKLASVPAKQVELANIHRADELATNSLTSIERELQRIHLSESVATGSSSAMQIIDEPSISGTSTPNTWIFGGGASFLVAGLIAALQFLLTPKRISAARLQTLMPLRTVGFIPQIDRGRGNSTSLIASTDRVRLALNEWFIDGGTVPVVVTSGGKDDGKSMTAYALSVCLADAGKNVLLIDADTKSPTIHRMCGISASPGLLQYLKDPTCDNLQIMQAIRPNLTVIPAGGISDNASCIKDSRFTRLVTEFAKNFDAIIIDSADCGDSLDSLVTPLFDCRWIAVVRIGQTLIQSVQNLGTQLELIPSMESVLVVNGVRTKDIAQLRQSTAGAGSVSGPTSGAALPTRADSKQFAESENAAW